MEEKTIKGWAARDKSGSLFLYFYNKPTKEDCVWCADDFVQLDSGFFPQVKWEDSNPTEIEIKIKE